MVVTVKCDTVYMKYCTYPSSLVSLSIMVVTVKCDTVYMKYCTVLTEFSCFSRFIMVVTVKCDTVYMKYCTYRVLLFLSLYNGCDSEM